MWNKNEFHQVMLSFRVMESPNKRQFVHGYRRHRCSNWDFQGVINRNNSSLCWYIHCVEGISYPPSPSFHLSPIFFVFRIIDSDFCPGFTKDSCPVKSRKDGLINLIPKRLPKDHRLARQSDLIGRDNYICSDPGIFFIFSVIAGTVIESYLNVCR